MMPVVGVSSPSARLTPTTTTFLLSNIKCSRQIAEDFLMDDDYAGAAVGVLALIGGVLTVIFGAIWVIVWLVKAVAWVFTGGWL